MTAMMSVRVYPSQPVSVTPQVVSATTAADGFLVLTLSDGSTVVAIDPASAVGLAIAAALGGEVSVAEAVPSAGGVVPMVLAKG